MTDFIHLAFNAGLDIFNNPQWRAWPFGSGYGDALLPSLARFAFVALLLGVILLFLRLLFGPKGIFRDKELDREAEELRQQEIAELTKQFEAGEVGEAEFQVRKRKIRKS
ncbi:SHOCT domain-containing protein [Pseudodesulfovibrio tunisiensis]|uniref:SHOCT domain-containing protein n=1 Tax=Pseudodesulfovibrio tunisiensis TaxID=463192 RepID=UPI001FB3534A|nr:SHOCT domain-containing protein [Pseudodesulfovibrio tunisiensis]